VRNPSISVAQALLAGGCRRSLKARPVSLSEKWATRVTFKHVVCEFLVDERGVVM
jgi:hypothetical protein